MSTVPRVQGWDALRGLCAMAVMAYHLLYWQNLALVPTLGTFGVYVFLILSGASLAYVYEVGQIGSARGAAVFLLLRWLRLAPLDIVVCALFVVMLTAQQGQWPQGTGLLMLLNASFLFGLFTPATSALAIGGWSLGIEFVFYLALPWILRALTHVRIRWMLLAVLVAIQAAWVAQTVGAQGLTASTHAYHQVPAFAAYFCAGCLEWPRDITYGTYLLHPMLFFYVSWFVLPAWTDVPVGELPAGLRWLVLLAVVLLSCVLARASDRWLEQPVRAAGRRLLVKRLTRRAPQSESASIAS